MKTPRVSLLLDVSVLLLSALTASAVSVNVRPNLQQFFTKDPPVSLSCVRDGQTVDGWTVKRTRGGQTEECGAAASDPGRVDGSSCVLDLTKTFTVDYLCETGSGQRSDPVTITVTDKDLILEIPALPVVTGSHITLRCRKRNGGTVKAYFFFNGKAFSGTSTSLDVTIRNVQQFHEGPHSCGTDDDGKSPESRLRVRDPPTTSDPPHTTSSSTTSNSHITTVYTPTAFNYTEATASSSFLIITVVAVLCSLVLLVLVVFGFVQLWRKQTGPGPGLRRLRAGPLTCGLIQLISDGRTSLSLLCCLTVLPAAGVAVLLYGLTLPPGSQQALGTEVYEGEESVLLPCLVSVSVSQDSTVVWTREELRHPTVHRLTQSGDVFDQQNQRYRDRTSMRTDALQTGDLSLTLRKPTIRDSGAYTCSVHRQGRDLSRTEVDLLVREPPHVSVIRLVLHLVVFCPFFISTGLMVSICCSRRTGDRPAVSMEMSHRVTGGHGLDKDEDDDITADVTTEYNF